MKGVVDGAGSRKGGGEGRGGGCRLDGWQALKERRGVGGKEAFAAEVVLDRQAFFGEIQRDISLCRQMRGSEELERCAGGKLFDFVVRRRYEVHDCVDRTVSNVNVIKTPARGERRTIDSVLASARLLLSRANIRWCLILYRSDNPPRNELLGLILEYLEVARDLEVLKGQT